MKVVDKNKFRQSSGLRDCFFPKARAVFLSQKSCSIHVHVYEDKLGERIMQLSTGD